jgi:hypothetical protein
MISALGLSTGRGYQSSSRSLLLICEAGSPDSRQWYATLATPPRLMCQFAVGLVAEPPSLSVPIVAEPVGLRPSTILLPGQAYSLEASGRPFRADVLDPC